MAGCLAGRFHLLALLGGEDAQAPKGSERAGWDLKIETCKFLSCHPAWATPAFLPPALGFHIFLDFNRSGMLHVLRKQCRSMQKRTKERCYIL